MNIDNRYILENVIIFVFLFGLWLLLSGIYTPLIIILGFISASLVTFLANRMFNISKSKYFFYLNLKNINYFIWLFKEMLIASRDVILITINPKKTFKPSLFKLKVGPLSPELLALYANSITYTPGTFSVIVKDEYIIVHALSIKAKQSLLSGEMFDRIKNLKK